MSWIGIWLLAFSAVVIVIELAIGGIWAARLGRRARRLSAQVAADQRALQDDVVRLKAAMAETAVLWQPYRRLLRYLRHPLAIALMQSYARRRSGAR